MISENRSTTGSYKIVIFDADAYIVVSRKNINFDKVLSREKEKSTKGYVSLWILEELLSGGDVITLQNVNKHCFDECYGWRFWADPISQVYYGLYKEEPPYIAEAKKGIEDFFNKALRKGLSEEEKKYIKLQLKQAGTNFVMGCLNYSEDIRNKKPDEIRRYAISQIIQQAKKIRCDSESIKYEEIDFFNKEFPAAGEYYEFLMKNILPQNKNRPSEEKLLHDLRDWHLFFYAGRDDIGVVTQEKKIRELRLKNVISLEEYLSKELSL
jgi:hypothetical protein